MPYADGQFEDAIEPAMGDLPEEDDRPDYWLRLPKYSQDLADEILDRMEGLFVSSVDTGTRMAMFRAFRTYYSMDSDGVAGYTDSPITSPLLAGENGEFVFTHVNQFRNLVKHQKTLITHQRPAWEPQAQNGGQEAARQIALARHVLDYAMDQRRVGLALSKCLETSLVLGSAYIAFDWDDYAGDQIGADPQTGAPKYTGDLRWHVLTPYEVVHQPCREYQDAQWVIYRTFENRYDLAERARRTGREDLAKEIEKTELSEDDFLFSTLDESGDTEVVPVYHLVVKPSPAVPQGRRTRVMGASLVLEDGALDMPRIPVVRMAPAEFLGTSMPYADSWDLLALHEQFNAVLSAVVTRIEAFGIPNVVAPEGSDFSVEDLEGVNLVSYPSGMEKPELLDLMKLPGNLERILQFLESQLERQSGINSVARGQPAENITSGTMAALVQSMAVQFNSGAERSYIHGIEESGTVVLQVYQSNADHPMLLSIAGDDKGYSVESFTGEAINQIKRVVVKSVNPMSKTTPGRVDQADKLLQYGMIRHPQEYQSVVATGQLNGIFTSPAEQVASIKAENAALLRGEMPSVHLLEKHDLHVSEHQAILDYNLKEAGNEAAVQAAERHIMQHVQIWQEMAMTNPGLCQALGIPPIAPPLAAQGILGQLPGLNGGQPQPQQQGPQQSGAPGGNAPAPKGKSEAMPGEMPGMPNMPKNPLTGEREPSPT